jgi:hypothetical protein
MSWYDWFQTGTGAITVIGALLGLLAWWQNRTTNALIASGDTHTQDILERMNQLAVDRHQEVLRAIQSPGR